MSILPHAEAMHHCGAPPIHTTARTADRWHRNFLLFIATHAAMFDAVPIDEHAQLPFPVDYLDRVRAHFPRNFTDRRISQNVGKLLRRFGSVVCTHKTNQRRQYEFRIDVEKLNPPDEPHRTHPYRGVYWFKPDRRWRTHATKDGTVYCGVYFHPTCAAIARNTLADALGSKSKRSMVAGPICPACEARLRRRLDALMGSDGGM